jgi:hypothetical protein
MGAHGKSHNGTRHAFPTAYPPIQPLLGLELRSKEWHRPYIEAFLETDNAELGALIAEAERAVVGRFLELLVSAVETDEFLDLQSAASALTQLKKARVFVDTPQHLVA